MLLVLRQDGQHRRIEIEAREGARDARPMAPEAPELVDERVDGRERIVGARALHAECDTVELDGSKQEVQNGIGEREPS